MLVRERLPNVSLQSSSRKQLSICRVRGAAQRHFERLGMHRGQLGCLASIKTDHNTKDDIYNRNMQRQMGWAHLNPYEYHFDRGLYYHEIIPNLICGSQPRNAADVAQLVSDERVTHILNLQQDKDLHYWGVSLEEIRRACATHSVTHMRRPARDFDPHSLRRTIPGAVHMLAEALNNGGRVYVHCTAGLGRAPAVCIAYLYWFTEMQLDEAYSFLTSIRPCGPKRDAVRGATYDILTSVGNCSISIPAANGNGTNGNNGNGTSHDPHHTHHHHHQHHHSHQHHQQHPHADFESLPGEAYARLSEGDRFALQYRVLRGVC